MVMNFISRLPGPRQARELKRKKAIGLVTTVLAGSEENGDIVLDSIDKLARSEEPWYKKNERIKLYFLLFPGAIMAYATSGYDGSMMNSLQTVSYWDDFFNNPRGSSLGLLSASMSLGAIISSPIAPFVADRLGRRVNITVGSIIMIAGAIIQCESKTFAVFVVSRFILGFGLTFCATAAPSLVAELSHPKERTTITSICNTCWFLGSIIAAWITFGTMRIPSLSSIWFLPESPRWLVSHGYSDQALEILKKYHGGGEATELVKLEFAEIQEAIKFETESDRTSWSSMLATKGNRLRLFLVLCMGIFSQWSGNGLISYYLSRVLDSVGITDKNIQALINGIINIWNFAIALSSAFFVDKIGRRTLFIVSLVGMTIVFASWTAASAQFTLNGNKSAGSAVIALIFIYEFFYCIAFSPLPVAYSVEVLPYSIRAKGMGVYVFSTKAATFVNQFVNPVGLANIDWKYYIVYCVWLTIETAVGYTFFVETKGYTLEEITIIFDGESALNMLQDLPADKHTIVHKEDTEL
ncbi:hexose transporter [Dipodascopsis uninucleata]